MSFRSSFELGHRLVGARLTHQEHAKLTELAKTDGKSVSATAASVLREWMHERETEGAAS